MNLLAPNTENVPFLDPNRQDPDDSWWPVAYIVEHSESAPALRRHVDYVFQIVCYVASVTSPSRLRERLSENGRQYIRQHHRWDAVMGRFERLVMRVKRS